MPMIFNSISHVTCNSEQLERTALTLTEFMVVKYELNDRIYGCKNWNTEVKKISIVHLIYIENTPE